MDHIAFRKIQMPEQLLVIMYHGVLLMEYQWSQMAVRLFALEGFYVELLKNQQTNEILTITSHPTIEGLDHFLCRIDISEIFPTDKH